MRFSHRFTFVQYLTAFCSRPEVTSDVISGRFMGTWSRLRWHFRHFFHCSFRPEVVGDVISGAAVDPTGEKVRLKSGDSRSNRSRNVRLPHFVTNDDNAGWLHERTESPCLCLCHTVVSSTGISQRCCLFNYYFYQLQWSIRLRKLVHVRYTANLECIGSKLNCGVGCPLICSVATKIGQGYFRRTVKCSNLVGAQLGSSIFQIKKN